MVKIQLLVGLAFLLLGAACTGDPCPQEHLVLVPAGWFLMGENDGRRSNQPQHRVYLDAYCIQSTEVTAGEFTAYLAATGQPADVGNHFSLDKRDSFPAIGVLWRDADAYCRWAGLRLPTEAEWEKAARGVDGRRFPWGNSWDPRLANTAESGLEEVLPVGSYPAGVSPYGLLDMAGNAAEWVADYFAFNYYQVSPTHNPIGSTLVLGHGLRGGSYVSPAGQATTYFRDSSHSAQPNPRVGFRCAVSVK